MLLEILFEYQGIKIASTVFQPEFQLNAYEKVAQKQFLVNHPYLILIPSSFVSLYGDLSPETAD